MKKERPILGVLIALLIVIPGVVFAFYYEDIFGDDDDKIGGATGVTVKDLSSAAFSIEDVSQEEMKLLVPTLSPLVVRHHGFNGTTLETPEYNPLILGTSKTAERHRQLTERELIEIAGVDDVEEASAGFLTMGWEKSELVIVVSSYPDALKAAPLASYLTVPMLFIEDGVDSGTTKALKDIGCRELLVVGEAPSMKGFNNTKLAREEVDEYFLDLLVDHGDESNYLVVTNPDDIWKYKPVEDRLPITDLSLVSAELAAYRKAPLLLSVGLDSFDVEYGDGFTRLGTPRDENNAKAEVTKQLVLDYVDIYESKGMDVEYLALVGGPVTLPLYYADITAYVQERQYTPSDYYFANLDDDPQQEIAEGRIVARDVSDASSMLISTLAFEEVQLYDYQKDSSSDIYDTVSEDWRENSLMAIGTTKIGPAPGILTPTFINQSRTMTEGDFHVTALGYDIATQAEIVKEIIDEMNYAVYYGHGNQNSWYSSAPDPIDADMINGQDLKPGFGIAMACLTGMIDTPDVSLRQMLSLAFIHSGFTGYIGADRVAYGLYDADENEEVYARGTGALYLADVFSKKVCKDDMDVGKALMDAKNDLIVTQDWDFEAQITVWEYVLYGDPAGNLYIPAFDS